MEGKDGEAESDCDDDSDSSESRTKPLSAGGYGRRLTVPLTTLLYRGADERGGCAAPSPKRLVFCESVGLVGGGMDDTLLCRVLRNDSQLKFSSKER